MSSLYTGSSASARKPVLFHSTFCNYCRTVLKFIAQNDMTDAFAFYQVDGNRNQIPRFVTSVPTMLLPDKRMLTDEAVWEYVKRLGDVKKTKKAHMMEVTPFKSSCGFGTFENLEGLPCDDIEDDGTYVKFDACPSITGVSSGDPSKPLSEAQIMAGASGGGANAPTSLASLEAMKKQRDDAMPGPQKNSAIMGGSLTGLPGAPVSLF